MTRPQIVRADTLDLQDHNAPSVQDHSRQPANPTPLGIGPAAPHQASAVRQVTEEGEAEEAHLTQSWGDAHALRDDPSSDDERTLVEHDHGHNPYQRDEVAIRQNGGMSGGEDGDLADAEGDDGLDDMMDKISSSPSISDGGYSSLPIWPPRASSLTPFSSHPRPRQHTTPSPELDSSSPFTSPPSHYPLIMSPTPVDIGLVTGNVLSSSSSSSYMSATYLPLGVAPEPSEDHHRQGEYASIGKGHTTVNTIANEESLANEDQGGGGRLLSETTRISDSWMSSNRMREEFEWQLDQFRKEIGTYEEDGKEVDLTDVLLPENDPALDNSFDDIPTSPHGSEDSWETDSDSNASWDEEFDDDDAKDIFFSNNPNYVAYGWSGECLRETEDIDFEFVYALHTFVATVEGQANATKGDTMVLLDDSNSYWWLVRIVKDSSIGYLPAEHIETPTERLARLNKHRNIDLSATMLGDNAEKSKNPLKKAMRRRNAKTVTFSAPTYVEASDYDYSSEEEDMDGDLFGAADSRVQEIEDDQETDQDEITAVEPLKVSNKKDKKSDKTEPEDVSEPDRPSEESIDGSEKRRSSDEFFDRTMDRDRDRGVKMSRNGTMRNTDSFFKDESVETRKITLTPNLLRDDSSSSTTRSVDSRERGASFDSVEKDTEKSKSKEDKKKKEKKPGMLSGLFKRKDKKTKSAEVDVVESDKPSEDSARSSPQSKDSSDSPPVERVQPDVETTSRPERQTSKGKLQKSRDGISVPKHEQKHLGRGSPEPEDRSISRAPKAINGTATSTMRLVSPEPEPSTETNNARIRSPDPTVEHAQRSNSRSSPSSRSRINGLTGMLRNNNEQPRRERLKKAEHRKPLDDFDEPSDTERPSNPFADPQETARDQDRHEQPSTEPLIEKPSQSTEPAKERLSESPVQISPPSEEETNPQQPQLIADTTSQEERGGEASPHEAPPDRETDALTSYSSSTSTLPTTNHTEQQTSADVLAPTASAAISDLNMKSAQLSRPAQVPQPEPSPPPSTSTSTSPPPTPLPPWSDSSLRAYLDDSSEIRDMLIVLNDTSSVVPVSQDHPIMAGLFAEERSAVKEMESQLDGLLAGWLEKKRARRATPRAEREGRLERVR